MKTKNWYKGLTATAISVAMAGAAFTVPALALDYDLGNGDVFIDGNLSWQNGENAEWTSNNPYDHSADGADKDINISVGTTDPAGGVLTARSIFPGIPAISISISIPVRMKIQPLM